MFCSMPQFFWMQDTGLEHPSIFDGFDDIALHRLLCTVVRVLSALLTVGSVVPSQYALLLATK